MSNKKGHSFISSFKYYYGGMENKLDGLDFETNTEAYALCCSVCWYCLTTFFVSLLAVLFMPFLFCIKYVVDKFHTVKPERKNKHEVKRFSRHHKK